jgi:hypothetical protein
MNGNGIEWSKTIGFILESQQDRSQLVTLYTGHICRSVVGFRSIEITTHADMPSFICKASTWTGAKAIETHYDGGIFLAHEPDQTPGGLPAPESPLCKVYFSFSFLMKLSFFFFRSNYWDFHGGPLCNRVRSQGNEQALQAREQMLKLCS